MIDLTTPQRQSPLAIVFLGLRILRSLGLAQLAIMVLFLFRAPLDGFLIALPFVAILLLGALSALAWWRYTFTLVDDELIVTKGVARVDRLTVPVDRIQSMAIDQQLLHRLTGLVQISIDTAGSSEAEFTIDAVARPVAEELQRKAITTQRTPNPDHDSARTSEATDETIVFTHGPQRLLRAAVTAWPLAGLIVIGPILAFGEQFLDRIPGTIPEVDESRFQWWWVPTGLAVFFAASVVLNIVRVFLQDWNLTLRANATSLRRTSGLFSRTSKASSVARVQVITSNQNPMQWMAGLRAVHLSTIGEGDLDLLGCDDDQWETILHLAQPERVADRGTEHRVSPAVIWLATRNTAVASTLGAVGAGLVVGWWSLLALVMVPLASILTRIEVRNYRWRLGSELATSSRVIDRSTELTLPRKANVVSVTQSIFERRRGLGSVVVSTAAGAIRVGMIPIEEARAVRDVVVFEVETDARPWM